MVLDSINGQGRRNKESFQHLMPRWKAEGRKERAPTIAPKNYLNQDQEERRKKKVGKEISEEIIIGNILGEDEIEMDEDKREEHSN